MTTPPRGTSRTQGASRATRTTEPPAGPAAAPPNPHPHRVNEVVDLLARSRENMDLGFGYTVVAGGHFASAEEQSSQVAQAYGMAQGYIARVHVPMPFGPEQPQGDADNGQQAPQPQPAPQPHRELPRSFRQRVSYGGFLMDYLLALIVGLLIGWAVWAIVKSIAHGDGNWAHSGWTLLGFALFCALIGVLWMDAREQVHLEEVNARQVNVEHHYHAPAPQGQQPQPAPQHYPAPQPAQQPAPPQG